MRRATPARAQEGRAGCQGALLGLLLGEVAAAVLSKYLGADAAPALALGMGAFGALLGAQVGQRLAARRHRADASRRRR